MLEAVTGVSLQDLLLVVLEGVLLWGVIALRGVRRNATAYYDARATLKQREWLRLVGEEAYHFAERAYGGHESEAKRYQASRYVRDRAEELGVELTNSEIRASIERAWLERQQPVQPVKTS